MKIAIRIALLVVIGVLAYFTFQSIAKPVKYQKQVIEKEQEVVDRLKVIRDGQLAYKDVHGYFTADFDTLINFMKDGQLKVIRAFGDRDDSTTVFRQIIVEVSVYDSLFSGMDVDQVRYVPGRDDLEFEMDAGNIEQNGVYVPVFQVTDPDPFSEDRRIKNKPLRVGNMFVADYSGNWGNR